MKLCRFAIGIFLSAFLAAAPWAQALKAAPNTATSGSLTSKLQTIEELKNSPDSLSSEAKLKLENLWTSANEISQLNNACREVALDKPLPGECKDLPTVLAAFEDKYLEVTGEIRLNAARIAAELSDRREMINRCYDAFPFEMLSPPELFRPDGLIQVEPLEEGTEISWEVSLDVSDKHQKQINRQLRKWYEVCKPHVRHQSSSKRPEFAPLFKSKMEKGDPKTGIVLKQNERGDLIGILSRSYTGIYSVNRQDVFKIKLESGYQTFEIMLFDKDPESTEMKMSPVRTGFCKYDFKFKGTKVVDEAELAGGLKTKLDWLETVKKAPAAPPKQEGKKKKNSDEELQETLRKRRWKELNQYYRPPESCWILEEEAK